MKFCFLLFLLVSWSFFAHSATIKFPETELPSEYALPYFKKQRAVLNRNVSLARRMVFSSSYVLRTDEPFFYPHSFQGSIAFYWSESHGIGVSTLFFPFFVSNNRLLLGQAGRTLREKGTEVRISGQKSEEGSLFDFSKAPAPFVGFFMNYYFSPFYGKLSLSKTLAFNFSLYSVLGLGVINFKQYNTVRPLLIMPAGYIGLGQRFYFNRWLALNGGADFLMYKGFNVVNEKIKIRRGSNFASLGPPDPKEFKQNIFFRILVHIGFSVLF